MEQNVQIGLEISIILIGLYLALVKSYFQEKGKSLATLEDIEKITSKVETIKTEFIKETERLKHDLQYLNQIKFSLKSEEIKSIFDCYEKYSVWLNILLNAQLTDIKKDDETRIDETNKYINKIYFDFLLSEAKFNLLVQDINIIQYLNAMKIKTLELQSYIVVELINYKHRLLELRNIEALEPAKQFDQLQIFFAKDRQVYQEFTNERLKQYAPIALMNATFQEKCYTLLRNMSEPS